MSGYIFDTSVLSPLLDAEHSRHGDVQTAIGALDQHATKFVSAIVMAELAYGVRLVETVAGSASPHLQRTLTRAHEYAVLEVTRHTSAAYAELKANVAAKYLDKVLRRDSSLGGGLDRQSDGKEASDRRERPVDMRTGEGARLDCRHGRPSHESNLQCGLRCSPSPGLNLDRRRECGCAMTFFDSRILDLLIRPGDGATRIRDSNRHGSNP